MSSLSGKSCLSRLLICLGLQWPSKAGGHLPPQARARSGLPGPGTPEPVGVQRLGVVRLVADGQGIRVASYLPAYRGRVPVKEAGDGADPVAQAQPVGDLDAFLLAQVAGVCLLGLVHGGTIPVYRWFLVPAGGPGASVPPDLAGAFRHPDRVGGLGEVHAFLGQQAHVLGPSGLAHRLPRRIIVPLEHPAAGPCPVIMVARGHLTLLAVGQVLQRSLELAVCQCAVLSAYAVVFLRVLFFSHNSLYRA